MPDTHNPPGVPDLNRHLPLQPPQIQPCGYIIIIDSHTQEVVQCSGNVPALLNDELSSIIGSKIDMLFNFELLEHLHNLVMNGPAEGAHSFRATIKGQRLILTSHAVSGHLILELEPEKHENLQHGFLDYADAVENFILGLESAVEWQPMLQKALPMVKKLTGFEQVMLYKFDESNHPEVVLEVSEAGVPNFSGHRFSASAFPSEVREYFRERSTAWVWDSLADPVPLVPEAGLTLQPELGFSGLRSLPPAYIQHLQEMQVRSSFVISLEVHNRQWGMICCHHYSRPLRLNIHQRRAGQFMGKILSGKIGSLLERQMIRHFNENTDIIQRLSAGLKQKENLHQLLRKNARELLDTFNAHGYYLHFGGSASSSEATDEQWVSELRKLLPQASSQVFCSHSLMKDFSYSHFSAGVPAGVLVLLNLGAPEDLLIFYRYEHPRVIQWAGVREQNPGLQALEAKCGFCRWTEEVKGESEEWSQLEQLEAELLRNALMYHASGAGATQ